MKKSKVKKIIINFGTENLSLFFFKKIIIDVVFLIASTWIKIRFHTENQLPMLSGSALKVSVGWCGPTHYLVNPNLELRLIWAVTITRFMFIPAHLLPISRKAFGSSKSPLSWTWTKYLGHLVFLLYFYQLPLANWYSNKLLTSPVGGVTWICLQQFGRPKPYHRHSIMGLSCNISTH